MFNEVKEVIEQFYQRLGLDCPVITKENTQIIIVHNIQEELNDEGSLLKLMTEDGSVIETTKFFRIEEDYVVILDQTSHTYKVYLRK